MNKLGGYITKLMTTVLDEEQEQFVKDLALSELTRLNVNVDEFIKKHAKDIFDKKQQEQEKQLLQEDKENVKDK
jgi:ribosomal protein S17E